MKTRTEILRDPEVFVTSILAIVLDEFGTECLEWDPNAWEMELVEAFSVEADDTLMDRLMAGISVLTSDSFFVDIHAFTTTCNSLNRGVVMSDTWIPADLDDVLWAVSEVRMLLGDDYSDEAYSPDIKRYVGVLLQQEGIKKVPSVLAFADIDDEMTDIYESYDGDEIMEQAFWDTQQKEKDTLEQDNMHLLDMYMYQLSTLPIKSAWVDSLKDKVVVPETSGSR